MIVSFINKFGFLKDISYIEGKKRKKNYYLNNKNNEDSNANINL